MVEVEVVVEVEVEVVVGSGDGGDSIQIHGLGVRTALCKQHAKKKSRSLFFLSPLWKPHLRLAASTVASRSTTNGGATFAQSTFLASP